MASTTPSNGTARVIIVDVAGDQADIFLGFASHRAGAHRSAARCETLGTPRHHFQVAPSQLREGYGLPHS